MSQAVTALRTVVGQRSDRVTAAREQVLAVSGPFSSLFPLGGLRRGSSVSVTGRGGVTSLALALVAEASAQGSWVAVLGMPRLGLVAAGELGLALDRCILVDRLPPGTWGQVVGALVGAVDVVVTAPPAGVRAAEIRRVAARLRERGTVMVEVGTARRHHRGSPAIQAEISLAVTDVRWEGLGAGHGRLTARRVVLERTGRGAASRPVTADLWLPGPDGRVAVAEPEPELAEVRSLLRDPA